MADFRVTVGALGDVHPHPNADRLDALEVLAAAGTGRPWGVSWIGEIAGRGIRPNPRRTR